MSDIQTTIILPILEMGLMGLEAQKSALLGAASNANAAVVSQIENVISNVKVGGGLAGIAENGIKAEVLKLAPQLEPGLDVAEENLFNEFDAFVRGVIVRSGGIVPPETTSSDTVESPSTAQAEAPATAHADAVQEESKPAESTPPSE